MIDNKTALHNAIEWSHLSIVKCLLNSGEVDFTAQDLFGRTVVDLAKQCNHDHIQQLVLQTYNEQQGEQLFHLGGG